MQSFFHIAYHVNDLSEAREFYGNTLGCKEGRSTDTWIDFNFFNHQISLHLGTPFTRTLTGIVGEHKVPMPHIGLILELNEWNKLADRLCKKNINFIISPTIRFKGQPGEQYTMFFSDPSGNPIEIKGFRNLNQIFDK
ncbi:VOC family protein [Spartinivicinus poritis]|uniref:VOC family protein n=1 Tax=Spartinivicinus poritis TaxID=2994640 RepID=A0ABT5U4Q7_9GAMM|nr:VOC family protein [Spartinivicinus sp. A2-2]MDE1461344.1 VOC family protein [Spartinivicinus sp. A2-2]